MKNFCILLCLIVFNLTVNVFAQDKKSVSIEMAADSYAVRGTVNLAPKRFFMVEFPVGDEVLTTASSDDDLIRGDESFVERNDGAIPLLFRAEKGWGAEKESVTILIMMKSGAVLNLEVQPVANLSESNDRVLWKYQPGKVASTRSKTMTQLQPRAVENRIAENEVIEADANGTILVSASKEVDLLPLKPQDVPPMPASTDAEAEKLAREMLLGLETENFSAFPKDKPLAENPDLTIAALSSQWVRNGTWTISVIGVQNKSRNAVQLVDFPRLRISTRGDKGQNLNDETIIPLGVATSSKTFPVILQPLEVVYFSYVFKTPVLGSTQNMQVLATHTNLADKPAIIIVRPGGTK